MRLKPSGCSYRPPALHPPRLAAKTFISEIMHRDISQITPLFIVGSPRSGTTVVMRAAETLKGYYSPHVEGHLLPWLLAGVQKVIDSPEYYPNAFLPSSACNGENFDKLLKCIGQAVDEFFQQIAGTPDATTGSWIDKTPDIHQIRRLPLLQRLFPKSRIIFTTRHPRDVVLSTRKVWDPPNTNRELLGRWNSLHREYRTAIRPRLDTERVLEIQQESIVAHPDATAKTLRQFLNALPVSENTLAEFFNEQQINRQKASLKGTFTYLDQCDSRFLKWVDSICGHEMSYWGYLLPDQVGAGILDCKNADPREPLQRQLKRFSTSFSLPSLLAAIRRISGK